MSPSPRRRTFLGSVAATVAATAGCAGLGSPEFASRHGTTTDGPLVQASDGVKPPSYDATVIGDEAAAERLLRLDRASRWFREDLSAVDYDDSFVAVFQSRMQVTEPGVSKGICPNSSVSGGRVTFSLPLGARPPKVEDERWFVVADRWRLNGVGAPTEAIVELVGPRDDGRRCRDEGSTNDE